MRNQDNGYSLGEKAGTKRVLMHGDYIGAQFVKIC